MKTSASYNKEYFPGAVVYFTLNGDRTKKYRAKITDITHHKYSTDMYDNVEDKAGTTMDSCMMPVRVTGKSLQDLFFLEVYSEECGVWLYYHLNISNHVNCVVASFKDKDDRQVYHLFVPSRRVRNDSAIYFFSNMNNMYTAMKARVRQSGKMDEDTIIKAVCKLVDTNYSEKVTFVHVMQKSCAKFLGKRLELSWKPLPDILQNPELNQYPEDWEVAWKMQMQNGEGLHGDLGLKYALNIGVHEDKMQLIMPINEHTLRTFFSFPNKMDISKFEEDVKMDYVELYEDNYPQVLQRMNQIIDIVGVKDTLSLKLDEYIIRPLNRNPMNIPTYMNVMIVEMFASEKDVDKMFDMCCDILELPEEEIPENSIFRNPSFVKNIEDQQIEESQANYPNWTSRAMEIK